MTRIIGIDPSLTATGVVILEDGKIKDQLLIKTKPSGDHPIKELNRLFEIRRSLPKMEDDDVCIMEGIAFMARNTSALIQLSALNYFIREKLYLDGIKFIVVPPTVLKKFISGKGNSPKELIILEIFKRYGVTFNDNNLADAYALARIGTGLMDSTTKLTKFQQEVISDLKKKNAL